MGYILKFLIFFLAIWVVISFVKKLASPNDQPKKTNPDDRSEAMIQCSVCGVYAPKSKISNESGKTVCSDCQKEGQDS